MAARLVPEDEFEIVRPPVKTSTKTDPPTGPPA